MNKLCSLFIALTYFTSFFIIPSQSWCYTTHWFIKIYSAIPNSQIDVYVRSGDDDLGHHVVTPDLPYKFDFCDNIWGNTLFVGDFYYKSRSAHFHVFDKDVENTVCAECDEQNLLWVFKEDGYYLSNVSKPYDDPIWARKGDWEY